MQQLLTLLLIVSGSATTVTISSLSQFVGASTTYIVLFEQHNDPSTIQIQFSEWSPNQPNPYQSDYAIYLQSASTEQRLTCKLKFSQTIIQCSIPSSPPTISLRITNIQNPSSTKPYLIDFRLIGATTQQLSGSFQVNQTSTQQISIFNYSYGIGETSSQVTLFMNFDYYVTSNTKLAFTFNSIAITFNPEASSGYTHEGNQILTNWNDISLGSHAIPNVSFVNPQAAISYTIQALLYYEEGAQVYNIQRYSLTIALEPSTFTIVPDQSQLIMGQQGQTISFSSVQCPFTGITPYVQVSFNTTQIIASTCTNETSTPPSKSCFYPSDPIAIADVGVAILTISQVNLTFRSFTNYVDGFYPLCVGFVLLPITIQTIPSVSFLQSGCSAIAGDTNSATQFSIPLSGYQSGDTVTINQIEGILLSPWSSLTYTIESSGSGDLVIPLPYSNPTHVSDHNQLTRIEVARPSLSLVYGLFTGQVGLCVVNEAATLPSLRVQMSENTTYASATYQIDIVTGFNDYVVGDYILLQFLNNEHSLTQNILVMVNGVTKPYVVDSINLRIIQSLDNGVSIYSITIENMLNPINSCPGCRVRASLFTELASLKESKQIQLSYEVVAITMELAPLSLFTSYNLSITLTNQGRSNYSTLIESSVEFGLPFSCGLTNYQWVGNSSTITFILPNCQTQYLLTDSISLVERVNSIISGTGTQAIVLTCVPNCQSCVGSCQKCVNASYSSFAYLYNDECFESCPTGTYLPAQAQLLICENCHDSCLSCQAGSTLNDCLQCRQDFTKSIDNICISTCGTQFYYSHETENCEACHPNCEVCINDTFCYVCRELAVEIAHGYCQLQECQGLCAVCEGQVSNCVQCPEGAFLYESSCYAECPSGTYQVETICQAITTPLLYFPVCICAFVLTLMACLCNACITRKSISLVSYCACVLAYMQLGGIIIIVFLTTTNHKIIGFVGLGLWVIANVIFTIFYCCRVHPQASTVIDRMPRKIKFIYYFTLFLCFLFTLRTYRSLYSGLFSGMTNYMVQQPEQKQTASNKQSQLSSSPTAIFLLNQPFVLLATILSLIASFLFLITGILEIMTYDYLNMLFWGIDEVVVVVPSIIMTVSDMWIGKRKGKYQPPEPENNQTVENLQEYVEEIEKTDGKIIPIQKEESQLKLTTKTKQAMRSKIKKNKVVPYFAKSKTIQHENNQEEEKKMATISAPGKQEHKNMNLEEEKRKTFSKSTIYQDFVKKSEKEEEEKDEQIPDLKQFNQADLGFDKKPKKKKDQPKARTTNLRETQMKSKNNPRIRVTDLFVDVDDDPDEKKTVVKGEKKQSSQQQSQQL